MKNPRNTKARRQCSRCKRVKSLKEFPRNKWQKLGYAYYCKPCHVRDMLEYRKHKKPKAEMW